ncbi:hypothetical protein GCM10010390_66730 [Streptomyces mordarskii]|uniref:Uncharacterized protein n=1 Tax=Streptomyces mordarskii TaxID=1226758 RepID=A0ABN1DY38_9ACTN
MKSIIRIVVVGAAAAVLATAMPTSAFAEDVHVDSRDYGARATWRPYGDHLEITDLEKDGHSAIGGYQMGSDTYYYWNTSGQGTTRYVNLNLPENRAVGIAAATGDYQGTPTGGLRWSTLAVANGYTS